MEHNLSSADYMERAEMHDCLANATADDHARQMHRAMAAEYRRRARDAGEDSFGMAARRGDVLEISARLVSQV